jgi:uroporphyrinogen decarboxylase
MLDALHFLETNPPPYMLQIEPALALNLDEYYASPAWRESVQDAIAVLRLPGLSVDRTSRPTYHDPFGSVWDTARLQLERPALSAPDLQSYHWPSAETIFQEADVSKQIEKARERGQFVVVSAGLGFFERTAAMRGYENALSDIVLHPEFYEALVGGILDLLLRLVERLASLPLEGILLEDDWSGQKGLIMGVEHWRRFIRPPLEKFFTAVHNTGKWTFLRSGGNFSEILPDLIECGTDVLHPLHPGKMELIGLKHAYGRQIRLWGGLDAEHLKPPAAPAEIRQEIQRLRKELSKGGGFILAPSAPLDSSLPVENAAVVVEEFSGWGPAQQTGSP